MYISIHCVPQFHLSNCIDIYFFGLNLHRSPVLSSSPFFLALFFLFQSVYFLASKDSGRESEGDKWREREMALVERRGVSVKLH